MFLIDLLKNIPLSPFKGNFLFTASVTFLLLAFYFHILPFTFFPDASVGSSLRFGLLSFYFYLLSFIFVFCLLFLSFQYLYLCYLFTCHIRLADFVSDLEKNVEIHRIKNMLIRCLEITLR